MLKLKKIAVTGSVASGKSTVTSFFKKLGSYTLDCDQIVHGILSKGALTKEVVDLLGEEVLVHGKPHPGKIAEKVFGNFRQLGELEKLIHPIVLRKICSTYEKVKHLYLYSLFVVETPLLFESCLQDLRDFFDYSILVLAEKKIAEKRSYKKDFAKRTKRLLPDEKKKNKADFVLQNNGSKETLKQQTKQLYEQLISS